MLIFTVETRTNVNITRSLRTKIFQEIVVSFLGFHTHQEKAETLFYLNSERSFFVLVLAVKSRIWDEDMMHSASGRFLPSFTSNSHLLLRQMHFLSYQLTYIEEIYVT